MFRLAVSVQNWLGIPFRLFPYHVPNQEGTNSPKTPCPTKKATWPKLPPVGTRVKKPIFLESRETKNGKKDGERNRPVLCRCHAVPEPRCRQMSRAVVVHIMIIKRARANATDEQKQYDLLAGPPGPWLVVVELEEDVTAPRKAGNRMSEVVAAGPMPVRSLAALSAPGSAGSPAAPEAAAISSRGEVEARRPGRWPGWPCRPCDRPFGHRSGRSAAGP